MNDTYSDKVLEEMRITVCIMGTGFGMAEAKE